MNWEVPTMQSKTSFFNRTLFLENLRRFWPLWAVYAAVCLVAQPLVCFITAFSRNMPYSKAELSLELRRIILSNNRELGVLVAVIFGLLFALALFSYMMSPRAVGMFHSFPIRREGLFLTNYLSGLIIFTGTQLLTLVLTALVQLAAGVPDFGALGLSLLVSWGQMLFFYSFSVFCAVFTGQILAVPVFYGVLNILAAGFCAMVQILAEQVYFGFSATMPEWIVWLTPVMKLEASLYVSSTWDDALNEVSGYDLDSAGLAAVGIYAAVGVVLTVLALLIYRRRASETAGDTVAVSWARPVFLYGVGICFAVSLGQGLYYLVWRELFNPQNVNFLALAVCMILLGLVGYWGAEMLLQKSFHVFRRSWKNAIGMAAMLMVLLVCVRTDILGVERYVPQPGTVEQLDFTIGSCYGSLTDPAEIEKFLKVHQAVVKEKNNLLPADNRESCSYFRLDYTLTGKQASVQRNYPLYFDESDLNREGSAMNMLASLATEPAVQRAALMDRPDETILRFTGGSLENYAETATGPITLDAEETQALYDALLRDIDAHHVGKSLLRGNAYYDETYVNYLSLYYLAPSKIYAGSDVHDSETRTVTRTIDLRFSANYTELLAEMDRLGILDQVELISYTEREQREQAERDGVEYYGETVIY